MVRLYHAKQLPEANLLISTECAIWITLSTLCRIGELSKTKLIDIDFENAIWKIPMENSKNNKPHKIYLSSFTLNQFLTLKTLVKSELVKSAPYLLLMSPSIPARPN